MTIFFIILTGMNMDVPCRNRVTGRVFLAVVEQELLTLPEYMSSPPVFSRVPVA
jgi:hypothetical protein